jgi:methylthioribose-1-phosphate isomerase
VNLAWAIARMGRKAAELAHEKPERRALGMREEAEAIHREDLEACRVMGKLGAERIPDGATVLTHCNAGALATGGYGTALGVIRAAHAMGKRIRVFADETRPYLQGARLTAWELHQDQIPVEVITDSMAGHFFQRGEINFCVVGSDRIAANGDVANKIGTYTVAVLAKEHGVPFTVAAPWSTVDLHCKSGADIVIEERARDEVARIGDHVLVGEGIHCRHPAFDVTPARLVTEIFTERGAFKPAAGEIPASLATTR